MALNLSLFHLCIRLPIICTIIILYKYFNNIHEYHYRHSKRFHLVTLCISLYRLFFPLLYYFFFVLQCSNPFSMCFSVKLAQTVVESFQHILYYTLIQPYLIMTNEQPSKSHAFACNLEASPQVLLYNLKFSSMF